VNAADLARDLGCGAVGGSSARLALDAYERWGTGLFNRLEGVYSIVIRDEGKDLTVAGVDARSVGSLFAARVDTDVWMASEAGAFRVDPRFRVQMSSEALAVMLTLGFPLAGDSLFAGVMGLPLGCHFEVRGLRILRVRHADDRDLCGGTLRGRAYIDHLRECISLLTEEAFSGSRSALPLTGGLDSRLLAAALPSRVRPATFTFGGSEDHDVRAARRIAVACGLDHRSFPLDPNYLARFADETVRVTEGRLNPAANITGCLMHHVADSSSFVSGQGGDFGRRFLKTVNLLPDWAVLDARPEEFPRRVLERHYHPVLNGGQLRALVGREAGTFEAVGRDAVWKSLRATSGLHSVDRLDLYCQEVEFWESRPQLLFASASIGVRAPFHTRRWVAAVMEGAPCERMDDLVRLQLISLLNPRVAAVPWVLTRMSMPASERLILALRHTRSLQTMALSAPSWVRWPLASLSRTAKARVYSHGEQRDDWIRAGVHTALRDILLDERCIGRGLFKEEGVRRLLDGQMSGGSDAKALGQLLNIELWHRRFVDAAPHVGGWK
jgi:asparagine synthetase B (glutamine-hydrolysing)